jgi:acetylornithine deacetylase
MAGVVMQVAAYAQSLTNGPLDHDFAPPYSSLQVGVIGGGQSVNIIPDRCTADIELRAIPGLSPSALLEPLKAQLAALRKSGFEVGWHQLSAYPGLSLSQESELTALLAELTQREPLKAVSYGTEAGLYQESGIDAIVCGPGDIAHAHRPNEYVEISELSACQRMMEDLGARLAQA